MGDLTISSTTDDAEDVQAALDMESPEPEAGEIRIDSTSDSQEQVKEAVGAAEEVKEQVEEPSRPDRKLLKRIDKLTARNYAAEARAAELERKLAEYQGRAPESSQAEEATAEDSAATDDSTAQADEKYTEIASRSFAAHQERMAAALAEAPDRAELDQLARSGVPIPSIVVPAIVEQENSEEVVLHLFRHPEAVEKLHSLSPQAAVAYIGRLSEQLENPRTNGNSRPVVSKAPKPITPVSGGMTRSTVDLDTADFQTYKRVRAQQERESER